MAADAGIDDARFKGATGALTMGTTYSRTLPSGATFTVQATHLLTDLKDNDADGTTDEADEDICQLVITGAFMSARRRVVAYLSPAGGPLPVEAALTLFNKSPQVQVDFKGKKAFFDGNDNKLNGGAGPSPAVYGLAIQDPATVADLKAKYSVDDESQIMGKGGAPSLGVSSSSLDLTKLIKDVKDNADVTLGASYTGANWGTGASGKYKLFYRNGNLELSKNVVGAGIMVVTGNLQVSDHFQFDGVLIVLGDVQLDDHVAITGALIQGPSSNQIQIASSPPRHVMIKYSTEAISAASGLVGAAGGNYSSLAGWQEIAGN